MSPGLPLKLLLQAAILFTSDALIWFPSFGYRLCLQLKEACSFEQALMRTAGHDEAS
jgi:hypothetical protein